MVTKVTVYCTGCGKEGEKRPDVLHADGTWTCLPCENKSRGRPELERFLDQNHGAGVEPAHIPGIGPCELWTGSIDKDGYGVFPLAGTMKQVRATRYAWELKNPPLKPGENLLHKCDNPPCVRLSHLWADTKSANSHDMVEKDRHAKGEGHGLHILTAERVDQVRLDYATGEYSQQDLADREGVSQPTISSAIRGATWKHVKRPST